MWEVTGGEAASERARTEVIAEEELKRSSVECGRSNAVAVHGSTGGEFSTDQGRPERRDRGLHSGWSTSRRP